MLYQHILPIICKYQSSKDSPWCTPGWPSCSKASNDLLMTLGKEAILRFPGRYFGHIAVHYYGLWSYGLIPMALNQMAALQRRSVAEAQQNIDTWSIPNAWRATPTQVAVVKESAAVVGARSLFLSDLQANLAARLGTTVAALIGAAATIAAFGMFVLPRLPNDIAALVVVAGFIVPYFAVNSLFQVALTRYTSTAEFGIAAFIMLTGFALMSRFWSRLSALSQRGTIFSN
jgi:hypothetical protein